TSLKWLETNNLFNNLIQRNQSAAFSSGKVRPNHETNINIIARRTGKDVNSHTVLDGIITTIMATIQRINIIGSQATSPHPTRQFLTESLVDGERSQSKSFSSCARIGRIFSFSASSPLRFNS